jgi:hypothetical protein
MEMNSSETRYHIRLEVVTPVVMKSSIFRVITPDYNGVMFQKKEFFNMLCAEGSDFLCDEKCKQATSCSELDV